MTLVLHKLLPLVVSPLGLVVLLVSLSVILRRRGPALIGLIVLLVCSLPMTADRLWERAGGRLPAPIHRVDGGRGRRGGPERDARVARDRGYRRPSMGRGHRPALRGGRPPQRRQGTPDHLHPGTVPVDRPPTRGRGPRQSARSPWVSRTHGSCLTGIATNTADEADEVKSVMDLGGMKRIILVTSAFHMPRARMLFERAGIESVPYPTELGAQCRRTIRNPKCFQKIERPLLLPNDSILVVKQ